MRRTIVATATRVLVTGLIGVMTGVVPADVGWAAVTAPGSRAQLTAAGCNQNWRLTQHIAIHGAGDSVNLNGVSAISNQDVWSVGDEVTKRMHVQPLIVQWNGSEQNAVATPNVSSVGAELDAVSLDGADDGWAVGFAQPTRDSYDTLAEQWNGTAWTQVTIPNDVQGPSATNLLIDTDALSPTDAWAVGYGDASPGSVSQPLAEQWNGSNWAIEPAVSVGPVGTVLLGVDGDSPDDVWAVGYSLTSTYEDDPVIEHWNGTAWSVDPGDPDIGDAVLTAVSTSGPDDAWAVGYTDDFQPVTEHWDGSSWSEVPTPPLGSVQLLRSVVDLSPTSAWAVGTAYVGGTTNSYEGVSLFWNGSQWSEETLAPAAQGTTQARGISAVPDSTSLWVAGGQYYALENACDPGAPTTKEVVTPSGPDHDGHPPRASAGNRAGVQLPASWSVRHPGAPHNAAQASTVVAVDEATSSGLAQSTVGWSATIGDFNGDGLPDIFLMRGSKESGGLYVNNGDGGFQEVDQDEFPPTERKDCVSADVSQNGLLDIFCAVGADEGDGLKANELYMQGTGTTFTDEADQFGVLDPTGRARTATFIDVTGSGPPDLFVGNIPFRADGLPHPNRLYLNSGGSFVDDPQAGLDLPIGATCATAGDYMDTGVQDLLICTPNGPEHLYQNNGGKFTDVTSQSGLPSVPALDAAFADLNGDGLLDIVLVTGTHLFVYLQNPDHTFTKSFGMRLSGGASVGVGDVNGDGSPDLLVTQSGRKGASGQDLMLLNNGSGTRFTEMPIPQVADGFGSAVYPIDFEDNGLTDFLVLNGNEKAPGPLELISFFPNVVPGAPTIESATATAGSGEAEVGFVPGTDDGSPVTSFTVTADDVTNPANGDETTSGTGSPITIGGLTSGDSYTFTVTATNATGTGPASEPSGVVTP